MRSFTVKHISALLLLTFGIMVWGSGMVKGQSAKVLAQYGTSVTSPGPKGAAGLLGSEGNLAGIAQVNGTTNVNTFSTTYTELKLSSGTKGFGTLGGGDGGSSSASIDLIPSGSNTTFPAGSSFIIKLTASILANVDIQSINVAAVNETPVAFSTLKSLTATEYVFTTTKVSTIIRINAKTGPGTSTSVPVTNNTNIYYAFYIPPPTINTTPTTAVCSGTQVNLAVNSPNSTLIYKWYTSANGPDLVATSTTYTPTVTTTAFNFYVEAIEDNIYPSTRTAVAVTVNPQPTLSVTTPSISTPNGAPIHLTATSSGTIKWYNESNTELGTGPAIDIPPFTQAGTRNIKVVATLGTCTNSFIIPITTYLPTACSALTDRVYATTQTITNNVSLPERAVDGDPKTAATLITILDALGLLATSESVFWSSEVPAGTPAVIKLGPGAGVLSLLSSISIVGLKKTGSTVTEIGSRQTIDISLLKLLSGENTFEYQFVPFDNTGTKNYDGIKIILSSTLAVGITLDLYSVYYTKPTTTIPDCTRKDVIDVLSGAVTSGLSVATGLISVTNPWLAVDGDETTAAVLNNAVNVAAYASETVIFASPSMPGIGGDSLKIVLTKGGTLLGVDLLTQFKIQRYLGNTPVGSPVSNTDTFLSIQLLSGDQKAVITLAPTYEIYDRVEIRAGGIATVLGSIQLLEVKRVATIKVIGSDLSNNITVCIGEDVKLSPPIDQCTKYKWYDAPTGGNEITTTNNGLTINTTGLPLINKFYIQPIRFGCSVLARSLVTLTVNPKHQSPHIDIHIN